MKNVMLWIVCVPAGMVVGGFVAAIFPYINSYVDEGSIFFYIFDVVGSGLGGYVSIYVSAWLVPSHKKWIALALLSIYLVSVLIELPLAITHQDWLYSLKGLAGLVGKMVIVYEIFFNKITLTTPTFSSNRASSEE